jgi:hypothetical protein
MPPRDRFDRWPNRLVALDTARRSRCKDICGRFNFFYALKVRAGRPVVRHLGWVVGDARTDFLVVLETGIGECG